MLRLFLVVVLLFNCFLWCPPSAPLPTLGHWLASFENAQGLEGIPDQLGYLVMSEDGQVLESAGELENDQHTAEVIMQMVRTACRFPLHGSAEHPFKRMSVILRDFVYTVTVSEQKVFVVKRQNNQQA